MPRAGVEPLPIPGHFATRPFCTNQGHFLNFSASETVEMLASAQSINVRAKGRFSIQTLTRNSALLYFFGIKVYEGLDSAYSTPIQTLASFNATVLCEQGVFAFKKQKFIGNGNENWEEDSWPCLLYHARYIFEPDPLYPLIANNPANLLEGQTPGPAHYYRLGDQQELTRKELVQMGISPINEPCLEK
ncbi:hypothetical protein [Ktedonobacter robiniae]|uniref:Uncharacterized protein n=1 Tax=Ktedonobacter robiniae TaxID=2778365 RepID=A0ABQ3V4S7_9CHLR|nr:hypothetical protein [Ktedonobacter robiniae]GHO59889.1 hypothetical protein KSB_83640 [Ktedonobacter robiniae]